MDTNNLLKNTFEELTSKFLYYLATILPFIVISEILSDSQNPIPLLLFNFLILPFLSIEIYEAIKSKRKPSPLNVFNFFNKKVIVTNLLAIINIFLWSLLLVIPGIIKSIAYQRAIYISHNNKDLSSNQAINQSMEEMKGFKAVYFIARLFIVLPSTILTLYFGYIIVNNISDLISVKYLIYSDLSILSAVYLFVNLVTSLVLSVFDGIFNNEIERWFTYNNLLLDSFPLKVSSVI